MDSPNLSVIIEHGARKFDLRFKSSLVTEIFPAYVVSGLVEVLTVVTLVDRITLL